MRIKRYTASSMQEALAQVRQEMGEAAFILQTRRLRPWWKPWQRARVEVVAAAEAPARRSRPQDARPVPGGIIPAGASASTPVSRPARAPVATEIRTHEAIWFDRLTSLDVESNAAWEMVQKAIRRSQGTGMDIAAALREEVARTVKTAPVWSSESHPRHVMLVGPTGVGKTTTVAKLAANFALIGGWRVGLVTTDTFRIGAIQQLRTYAELVGLNLIVADSPEQLRGTLESGSEDLYLIDTAGHSPNDETRRQDVLAMSAALPAPLELLLVVPASIRQGDLAEMIAAYRTLPLSGVVVTKLDETRRRGALINAPRWTDLPLAYLTTGQAVPDDIEAADGDCVADWLLGEWAGRKAVQS